MGSGGRGGVSAGVYFHKWHLLPTFASICCQTVFQTWLIWEVCLMIIFRCRYLTLSIFHAYLYSLRMLVCYFAFFFFDWILSMKQIQQIDLTGMEKVDVRSDLSFSSLLTTVILHYQSSPTSSSQKSDWKRICLVIFQIKAGSNLIPVTFWIWVNFSYQGTKLANVQY